MLPLFIERVHLSSIPFWNITYPVKWRRSTVEKNGRTCNFALATTITNIANFLRSPFSIRDILWHLFHIFFWSLLFCNVHTFAYIMSWTKNSRWLQTFSIDLKSLIGGIVEETNKGYFYTYMQLHMICNFTAIWQTVLTFNFCAFANTFWIELIEEGST